MNIKIKELDEGDNSYPDLFTFGELREAAKRRALLFVRSNAYDYIERVSMALTELYGPVLRSIGFEYECEPGLFMLRGKLRLETYIKKSMDARPYRALNAALRAEEVLPYCTLYFPDGERRLSIKETWGSPDILLAPIEPTSRRAVVLGQWQEVARRGLETIQGWERTISEERAELYDALYDDEKLSALLSQRSGGYFTHAGQPIMDPED